MENTPIRTPKRTISRFKKPIDNTLQDDTDEVAQPSPKAKEPAQETSKERAARRAAELRGHAGNLDEGTDDFYIPVHYIPDGWSYEWKMKSVLGAEDPAYAVSIARKGWEPVPASRHPSMMPEGNKYQTIERKGMILMERPLEITDEARRIERRKAVNQVRQKEEQLNSAPQGQFDRNNKDAPLARVRKGYEPMPIPEEQHL